MRVNFQTVWQLRRRRLQFVRFGPSPFAGSRSYIAESACDVGDDCLETGLGQTDSRRTHLGAEIHRQILVVGFAAETNGRIFEDTTGPRLNGGA